MNETEEPARDDQFATGVVARPDRCAPALSRWRAGVDQLAMDAAPAADGSACHAPRDWQARPRLRELRGTDGALLHPICGKVRGIYPNGNEINALRNEKDRMSLPIVPVYLCEVFDARRVVMSQSLYYSENCVSSRCYSRANNIKQRRSHKQLGLPGTKEHPVPRVRTGSFLWSRRAERYPQGRLRSGGFPGISVGHETNRPRLLRDAANRQSPSRELSRGDAELDPAAGHA